MERVTVAGPPAGAAAPAAQAGSLEAAGPGAMRCWAGHGPPARDEERAGAGAWAGGPGAVRRHCSVGQGGPGGRWAAIGACAGRAALRLRCRPPRSPARDSAVERAARCYWQRHGAVPEPMT